MEKARISREFGVSLSTVDRWLGGQPDVLVCAPPVEMFRFFDRGSDEEEEDETQAPTETGQLDFHDLLKAKSLGLRVPIQFVRPATYDPTAKEIRKKGTERRVQDPATRAWNFFTALYYKAGGTPWRLARDPSDLRPRPSG